jgi:hypothetical protein
MLITTYSDRNQLEHVGGLVKQTSIKRLCSLIRTANTDPCMISIQIIDLESTITLSVL